MQSLLRTKPENLDDLTVQVALVRPGPIQGKAVHPYIDARERLPGRPGLRAAGRPRAAARAAPRHARRRRLPGPGARGGDGARRLHDRRGGGAAAGDEPEAERGGDRGVPRSASSRALRGTASTTRPRDRVYDKLAAFSGFGFPKSHAAAFGLLAYQSAWLRHHYPAEFLCSLLNAQPMGFYPPVEPRAGRAAARGGGAPAGRQPRARSNCTLGGGRRADRARVRQVGRGGRRRGGRRRAGGERAVRGRRRPLAARAARCARARGAPAQRRLRPLGQAARPALGARRSSSRPQTVQREQQAARARRSTRPRRRRSCPT